MPAKRARINTRPTASSSSSPEFDRFRFLSDQKEEFYSNVLAHKECVKERGVFYRKGRRDPLSMQEVMETRKWGNWVNPIHIACEVMVREFFANAYYDDQDNKPDAPTFSSWFRGDVIDYGAERIREFLGLLTEHEENALFPRRSRSTFHYLLSDRSSEFLKDLEVVVVRPGQKCEEDDKGNITYLLRQNMTPLARVWAEFLQDSLFPSSHKSEVRTVVLIVIYRIIRGHPMDVARIISDKIYSHYNVGKERPRPIFPHLICALIHDVRDKARRPIFIVQKRLTVSPILNKDRVNQLFKEWMSRMPQEEEEEDDPTEPAEEEEE